MLYHVMKKANLGIVVLYLKNKWMNKYTYLYGNDDSLYSEMSTIPRYTSCSHMMVA